MFDLGLGMLAAAEAAEVASTAVLGNNVWGVLGAVISTGIIVFGAALGIGKIAASATEAIARQPEAGGRINTAMLLACAFIEGGMLMALIICLFAVYKLL